MDDLPLILGFTVVAFVLGAATPVISFSASSSSSGDCSDRTVVWRKSSGTSLMVRRVEGSRLGCPDSGGPLSST